MGCKIVIYSVLAARAMRQNVIRLPTVTTAATFDHSAANMAPAASFR
jgi:hypothetical protein